MISSNLRQADPEPIDGAARKALDAFIATDLPGYRNEPLDTQIADLITNLCHLARREAGATNVEAPVARAVRMHSKKFVVYLEN